LRNSSGHKDRRLANGLLATGQNEEYASRLPRQRRQR
jgi:hypothetical protein